MIQPRHQARLRKEGILSQSELEHLRENLPATPPCEITDDGSDIIRNQPVPEDVAYSRSFDTNGINNLVALAELRRQSQRRVVLDLAFESSWLGDAEYRRYRSQINSDAILRPSIALQYIDGAIYRGGELLGTVQTRNSPTGPETILRMFQGQDWPRFINAPEGWDKAKVKRVCRQLRKRFENELHFGEGDGGNIIRLNDIGGVAPN